jgi:hypothetical protein
MDFATAHAALITLVAALSGVNASFVVFKGLPQPRHNGQLIRLSWLSMPTVGTDETRYENDGSVLVPDPNLTPAVVSLSRATLQVEVECNDNRATGHAFKIARQILNRVRRPSSLEALRAVNLGLAGTTGPIQADYTADDHNVSRAIIEFAFNASNFDVDTEDATGSIESVDVTTNTLDDVDGDPLPDSLQLDHVDIPEA